MLLSGARTCARRARGPRHPRRCHHPDSLRPPDLGAELPAAPRALGLHQQTVGLAPLPRADLSVGTAAVLPGGRLGLGFPRLSSPGHAPAPWSWSAKACGSVPTGSSMGPPGCTIRSRGQWTASLSASRDGVIHGQRITPDGRAAMPDAVTLAQTQWKKMFQKNDAALGHPHPRVRADGLRRTANRSARPSSSSPATTRSSRSGRSPAVRGCWTTQLDALCCLPDSNIRRFQRAEDVSDPNAGGG